MKKNEFPKVVYVAKEEDEADGSSFLLAEDDADAFAVVGVGRAVGIYKLDKVVTVTAERIIKINDKK
jgi:hypothetical protein